MLIASMKDHLHVRKLHFKYNLKILVFPTFEKSVMRCKVGYGVHH